MSALDQLDSRARPLVELRHFPDHIVAIRNRDGQIAVVANQNDSVGQLVDFVLGLETLAGPTHLTADGVVDSAEIASVPSISLMVAQTCNLRCVYCFAGDGDYGAPGIMNWSEAKAAIDSAFFRVEKGETVRINFFGGEPMLAWPLIVRAVTYARFRSKASGKPVGFSMTTNGTLVSQDRAEFMAREGFLVLVSIDGTSRDHNTARRDARGRDSWDQVVGGAKLLLGALGPARVGARATLRANHSDYERINHELAEIGFSDIHISVESVAPERLPADEIPEADWMRRVVFSQNLAQKYSTSDLVRRRFGHGFDPLADVVGMILDDSSISRACGVGRESRALAVDGSVFPCHRFVGDQRFAMASDGARSDENVRMSDGAKELVKRSREVTTECRSCFAWRFCAGGCVHVAIQRVDAGLPAHDASECAVIRENVWSAVRAMLGSVDPDTVSHPVRLWAGALGREFKVQSFRALVSESDRQP